MSFSSDVSIPESRLCRTSTWIFSVKIPYLWLTTEFPIPLPHASVLSGAPQEPWLPMRGTCWRCTPRQHHPILNKIRFIIGNFTAKRRYDFLSYFLVLPYLSILDEVFLFLVDEISVPQLLRNSQWQGGVGVLLFGLEIL